MGILYLSEPGGCAHLESGRIKIKLEEQTLLDVPFNQVEGIVVFSGVNLTTRLHIALLEAGVPVTFLSSRGKYFGKLEPVQSVNVIRQLKQVDCMKDPVFRFSLARSMVHAKIFNASVVIREFARHHQDVDLKAPRLELKKILQKIEYTVSIDQLIGYEGQAAKIHYSCMSQMTTNDYRFKGRSRNPPKDPFNSMLSFGYTILMFDLYSLIQIHGLSPYYGFLHKPKNGHAALASDMMEEWRPVLVDAFVLHLANRNTFQILDFDTDAKGGVYLKRDKSKLFIKRYEERLKQTRKNADGTVSFNYRTRLESQTKLLARAIDEGDWTIYKAFYLK